MKNTFENLFKTALAVIISLIAAACAKEGESGTNPGSGTIVDGDGKIIVTLEGAIDGYSSEVESKASAENVISIMWKGGETIYVYEGRDYLGFLTASIDGTESRYAKLSGTIDAPAGGKAITLVYSPSFSGRPDEDGKISLDLSIQSDDDVPFLIYSVIDSLEGTTAGGSSQISTRTVTFKLATSVFKCNCADLPSEGTISNVIFVNVNTICEISLFDDAEPTVGGSGRGTIVRSAGLTAADRRLIFSAAMAPHSDNYKSRRIIVTKDNFDYDSQFRNSSLESGKAYNDVFVFKPVGALPGKFTVDAAGKQVYFSNGNLWRRSWNGRALDREQFLEHAQWETLPHTDSTWDAKHRAHYFWSKVDDYCSWEQYNEQYTDVKDVFFTNKTETTPNDLFVLIVDDKEQRGVWRVLSDKEWQYLLYERKMTFGKKRFSNWTSGIKLKDQKIMAGLFIYPDDYNMHEVDMEHLYYWDEINSAGIAFLPGVGYREKDQVRGVALSSVVCGVGEYWTSNASKSDNKKARSVYFWAQAQEDVIITFEDTFRGKGSSVRLVRDYK